MSIVLLGPRGVGKSSVAKKLETKLGYKHISLDDEGKKLDVSIRQTTTGRITTVKNVFEEYRDINCILDFGCFHSFYTEEPLFNEIKKILSSEANIYLLIPSEDTNESIQILHEMNSHQISEPLLSIVQRTNENFLLNSKNEQLAKHIVYTKGLSFEEIAEKILLELNTH